MKCLINEKRANTELRNVKKKEKRKHCRWSKHSESEINFWEKSNKQSERLAYRYKFPAVLLGIRQCVTEEDVMKWMQVKVSVVQREGCVGINGVENIQEKYCRELYESMQRERERE
jgi:hypothetical protein